MIKSKGFTLIELIVVIAIIGILATIVMIAINPEVIINRTNDTKARSELNQVKTSLQLYFNDNNSYPPAGTWIADLENGDYIRDVPTGITYGRTTATDYDAYITISEPATDESNSFTKCTSDGNNGLSSGTNQDYWICPD